MDKYTIRILALALLSLYLVCSATVAQCQIMADTDGEKISLSNGLCTKVNRFRCSRAGECFCCLTGYDCYFTMDECKKECNKSSASEDILVEMTSPPLPAP
ncbi:hypothetical protein CFC21_008552 [Triticum aestivum]|uniref:Meg domain-containing protein n=2 Tax=Triticum aestivum TaxID=4565 RepID=A0A9R1DG79_WHEAT|nr:hypothetical protein CFC21_008552 [Triticum aestivum]